MLSEAERLVIEKQLTYPGRMVLNICECIL